MKKTLLSVLLFCSLIANAQVGIGVSVANIEPSAQLEVKSTNKGLLIPRMNEAQKNAIDSPATGLLVYQTDGTSGFYYYDGAWKQGFGSQGATDTVSLSNRINAKSSLSDTSLLNLASRFETKLNKTDTATLSNRINAKLSKTDTASLSNRIDAKLSKTDTASLSNRINTKLNISNFPNGTQIGNMMYWNGTSWVILAPGATGQVLKMSSTGAPVWGAYATNSTTGFSPCGTTITDIDGNSYNTVLIGSQCWTKENLRVRKYNNGTAIGFNAEGGSGGSSGSITWPNSTIGLHTIYANDSTTTPSNLTKYGYLYNWYAAKGINTNGSIQSTDTLNVCPSGWHVPTDAEWTTLTDNLGGVSVAGSKIKSVGTAYWSSPNTGATNESGFSALPGGVRGADGSFEGIRNSALFWSATESSSSVAWIRTLSTNDGIVIRVTNNKSAGASIRCIRN